VTNSALTVDITFISELYRYNDWANEKTLAAAAHLDNEKFARQLGNSFSSVRDTLVHILGAEWIWLERWNGRFPRALLSVSELPTLSAIAARWRQVEESRNRFLQSLRHSDLNAAVSYVNQKGETWSYPLWQQMVHVVNHSSYHRGQTTTLLRQLGAQPVTTDFLVYYDEKSQDSKGRG
jgi:uncharacterized damage-inducible protein DinB